MIIYIKDHNNMKKLRYIFCLVEQRHTNAYKEFDDAGVSEWEYNVCFITDYLSLKVRKLGIETPFFNLLSVSPRNIEKGYIDNDEYLQLVEVFTPFSNDEMLALINTKDFKTRIEMYLSVLERGYRIASEYYDIQIDKLLELHRQFREGGYKHEWLFKKKPIKEYGIYVFFNCYFTTIDFRLELEVYDIKKTQLLTKGVVFRTAPDRIHFGKDFNKGIEIDNDKMYLLDFLEKRAFEFDLDKLSKGEFNVIQLSEVRDYTEIIDRINWLK